MLNSLLALADQMVYMGTTFGCRCSSSHLIIEIAIVSCTFGRVSTTTHNLWGKGNLDMHYCKQWRDNKLDSEKEERFLERTLMRVLKSLKCICSTAGNDRDAWPWRLSSKAFGISNFTIATITKIRGFVVWRRSNQAVLFTAVWNRLKSATSKYGQIPTWGRYWKKCQFSHACCGRSGSSSRAVGRKLPPSWKKLSLNFE